MAKAKTLPSVLLAVLLMLTLASFTPLAQAGTVPTLPDSIQQQVDDDTTRGEKWENFANWWVILFTGIRPVVIAAATIAIIVDAMGILLGGDEARERFKRAFPFIVAGALIVSFALTIANGVVKTLETGTTTTSTTTVSTVSPRGGSGASGGSSGGGGR